MTPHHKTGMLAENVPSAPGWREYYEWEADKRRYLPGDEPGEAMRVEFVFRLLKGVSYERPLDAGCGDGYLASRLAEAGGKVWGTDLSLARLKVAHGLFPRLTLARSSIFDQPFGDRSFDVVMAVEVIEHLEDPESAVQEMKRLSSRYVLVTVPYRGKLEVMRCPHCHQSYFLDGHMQSFDEDRVERLLKNCGLAVRKLEVFVPYYPPRTRPMNLLPRAVNQAVRRAFEKTGLKEPTRPKFIGALAERID
jgi:SAM-dependent methyltransferase